MFDRKPLVLVVDNSNPSPCERGADAGKGRKRRAPGVQTYGSLESYRPRRERLDSVAREQAAQMRSLADRVEQLTSTGSNASLYVQLIEEIVRVSCGILEAAVCLSALIDAAQESGVLPRGPDDGSAPAR